LVVSPYPRNLRLGIAVLLLLAGSVRAQGTIKFDHLGRYDTVLTSTDTARLKLTLMEFHRKLVLAGYATYFWRDPSVLAKYTDVEAESIRAVSDTLRLVILGEISRELELALDSLLFDKMDLRTINFLADTLARVTAMTPFAVPGDLPNEPATTTYMLHRVPDQSSWWVGSTIEGSDTLVFRNYLDLPDEDIKGLRER
jgi:hypothetical protein